MDPVHEKNNLRRQLLTRMRGLGQQRIASASALACERLIDSPLFREAGVLMAYWPMATEADPRPLVRAALDRGKQVAVPHVSGQEMSPVALRTLEGPMEADAKGILVPRDREPIAVESLDLVVVPALAFDRAGRRLGRGGGFYDRFLVRCDASTRKIGFGITEQCVDAVPVEDHDVMLDGLVTDEWLEVIDR